MAINANQDDQVKDNIKKIVEVGEFAENEQSQYSMIMKAVKAQGGIDKLNPTDLKELEHIVKTLGSKSDKADMMIDEVNDFVKSISKNNRHK